MMNTKQMKQSILRHTFFMSLVLFASIMLFAVFKAWAVEIEIACGDTIDQSGEVTLNADLNCENSTTPTLTVVGPSRLNLNGFIFTGKSGSNGIEVNGKGAAIINGTIKGARRGIVLQGDGYHKVFNVTIEECLPNGDGNRRGIRVRSNYNKLINNHITTCNKGIRVDEELKHNEIVGNIMEDNDAENCDVKGDKNLIVNNIADGGGGECFLIDANDNKIVNNSAFNCQQGGFVAEQGTSRNYFINNTAAGNWLNSEPKDLIDNNNDECKANKWINNTANYGDPDCTISN